MTTRQTAMALALATILATPALAHDTDMHHRDGARVKEVQQALQQQGYEIGSVDGVMGQKTRKALRKFQKEKGLNANGQLNDETLAALNVPHGEHGGATSGTRGTRGAATPGGLGGRDVEGDQED